MIQSVRVAIKVLAYIGQKVMREVDSKGHQPQPEGIPDHKFEKVSQGHPKRFAHMIAGLAAKTTRREFHRWARVYSSKEGHRQGWKWQVAQLHRVSLIFYS